MSDKVEIVGRRAKIDARSSSDPDGSALGYEWKLRSSPDDSASSLVMVEDVIATAVNTITNPDIDATVTVGDFLLFQGNTYEITNVTPAAFPVPGDVTVSGSPFTVGAVNETVWIFKSSSILHNDESIGTIDIDAVGQYMLRLRVWDGVLWSDPADILIDGREWDSILGEVIDGEYMWNYLSDVYSIVQEREYITEFFAGITQHAASTMLKALQVETGVSLENIQPYFYYRWMKIDSFVQETNFVDQMFTPAYGEISSDASVLPIAGDTVNLRIFDGSDVYVEEEYEFVAPATLVDVVNELNIWLSNLGYAITADSFTWGGADYITLNGSLAFEVLAGTAPIFTTGQNNWLYGLNGVKLDQRLYKIEGAGAHTLRDFQLEGHFLVVRGESYPILSVETDTTDSLPSIRLVLGKDLPDTTVLADLATWAIPGFFTSSELSWEDSLVFNADVLYMTLLTANDEEDEETARVVGVEGRKVGVFTSYPTNSYYSTVLASKVRRYSYHPLDDTVVRIPRLQEIIKEPEDLIYENNQYLIDYYRGQKCIIFDYFTPRDFTTAGSPIVPISIEDEVTELMWAEHVIVSNKQTVSDNFGARVYFDVDTYSDLDEVEYLSSVRGLWFIFSRGKTIENLKRGLYIFFALPFAEQAGTIEQIATGADSPYGRIFVRDDDEPNALRTYIYDKTLGIAVNPDTGSYFQVGDHVDQFTPLVEGIDVVDWISEPGWFGGMLSAPHFMDRSFYEVQKYHKWLIRIDSEAYTYQYQQSAEQFVDIWRPKYLLPIFVIYHKVLDEFTLTDEITFTANLSFVDVFCHEIPHLLDMGLILDDGDPPPPPPWDLDDVQFCPTDVIDVKIEWTAAWPPATWPTTYVPYPGAAPIPWPATPIPAFLDTSFFLDPDPDAPYPSPYPDPLGPAGVWPMAAPTLTGDEKGVWWYLDDTQWAGPPPATWTTIYPW
jgi:hypothetical protein